MKWIRMLLKPIVLFFDWAFAPTPIKRSAEAQMQTDRETLSLTLYHLKACPFCVKVRHQITRLALKIEMKDIGTMSEAAQELIQKGGQDQVPCLRIAHADGSYEWMYESSVINEYLSRRFGPNPVEHKG